MSLPVPVNEKYISSYNSCDLTWQRSQCAQTTSGRREEQERRTRVERAGESENRKKVDDRFITASGSITGKNGQREEHIQSNGPSF